MRERISAGSFEKSSLGCRTARREDFVLMGIGRWYMYSGRHCAGIPAVVLFVQLAVLRDELMLPLASRE